MREYLATKTNNVDIQGSVEECMCAHVHSLFYKVTSPHYWPGIHNTAFSDIFADTCLWGYFWQHFSLYKAFQRCKKLHFLFLVHRCRVNVPYKSTLFSRATSSSILPYVLIGRDCTGFPLSVWTDNLILLIAENFLHCIWLGQMAHLYFTSLLFYREHVEGTCKQENSVVVEKT